MISHFPFKRFTSHKVRAYHVWTPSRGWAWPLWMRLGESGGRMDQQRVRNTGGFLWLLPACRRRDGKKSKKERKVAWRDVRMPNRTNFFLLTEFRIQLNKCVTCCEWLWQPVRSRAHRSPWAAPVCRPSGLHAPTDLASLRPGQTGPPPSCCGIPPRPESEHPDAPLQPLPALGCSEPADVAPLCCLPGGTPKCGQIRQTQKERLRCCQHRSVPSQ